MISATGGTNGTSYYDPTYITSTPLPMPTIATPDTTYGGFVAILYSTLTQP
jgi:hypothetical protein